MSEDLPTFVVLPDHSGYRPGEPDFFQDIISGRRMGFNNGKLSFGQLAGFVQYFRRHVDLAEVVNGRSQPEPLDLAGRQT